jgi:hypothetical protein
MTTMSRGYGAGCKRAPTQACLSVIGPRAKCRRLIEVRIVRHSGLDLLTLGSSHFDLSRHKPHIENSAVPPEVLSLGVDGLGFNSGRFGAGIRETAMRQFSPRQLVHGLVALSLAMCSQGPTLAQSDKTPAATQASTTPGAMPLFRK